MLLDIKKKNRLYGSPWARNNKRNILVNHILDQSHAKYFRKRVNFYKSHLTHLKFNRIFKISLLIKHVIYIILTIFTPHILVFFNKERIDTIWSQIIFDNLKNRKYFSSFHMIVSQNYSLGFFVFSFFI